MAGHAPMTSTNEVSKKCPDPEPVIKHPLQNRWTLWFFKNDRSKNWVENNQSVSTFDTIEDFWSLYRYTKPASHLQAGCDYSLFKHGIQPMWEDAANKQGGRWIINLNRHQRNTELDTYWLDILLCLIGEAFDASSDEVCGAVVNIRPRGDKLAVWTGDVKKADAIKAIGHKVKDQLGIPQNVTIGYQMHAVTMVKSGSSSGSSSKHHYSV